MRSAHGVLLTALLSDQCGPTLVRKTGLGVLCCSMSMALSNVEGGKYLAM